MLRRRVVPRLGRRRLEVPHVFAARRPQRDDRGKKQIVALARRPDLVIPRTAVADADVQQVELLVIRHRIPHRAAAAVLPPFAVPGGGRFFHRLALEAVLRIAGDGIEAPQLLAGRRLIRGDIAAHAHLAAAVADDDLALDDARRARDGVTLGGIGGLYRPHRLARVAIECDEPPVERAQIDIVAPRCDTAIHDVAAGIDRLVARDLRIEAPFLLAGPCIDGEGLAPCRGEIHRAVDHERRRFLAAAGVEIEVPGQTQVLHVLLIDLRHRAVALLVVGATVCQPFAVVGGGAQDARGINACGVAGDDGQGSTRCQKACVLEHGRQLSEVVDRTAFRAVPGTHACHRNMRRPSGGRVLFRGGKFNTHQNSLHGLCLLPPPCPQAGPRRQCNAAPFPQRTDP